MIEKKFSEEPTLTFGYKILISEDKRYAIASPSSTLIDIKTPVNVLDYLEKKGYNLLFASRDNVLYFRSKKK